MGKTRNGPHDDSGIVLAIVMSVIALMVLLGTAAFYIASQTLFETQMAAHHDSAFQAASSGIVVAFADLRSLVASGTAPTGTWVTTGTVGASYAAVTTFNTATNSYDCTSTGTTPDGTQEVVVASFEIVPPSSQPLPFGNNVFYFGGAQVGSVNGNGTVAGAFFVLYPPSFPPAGFPTFQFNGDEQMSGGPVYIQNGNFQSNKAAAGTNPTLVYTNGTVNGSTVNGVNRDGFIRWPLEATATLTVTRVNVSSFLSTSLANATAQSSDNILGNTATTVPEVNTTGVPSTYRWVRGPNVVADPYKVVSSSVASAGLTINSSTASFGLISGGVHDDFAYDKASTTLYVEGTVFVWGKLTISSNVSYVGNGTIVCSGDAEIDSDVLPLSGPDATHLLCLFTAGQALFPSNNRINFTGAFYAVGPVSMSGNKLELQGAFLSEGGLINAQNSVNLTALPLIGAYISPGMPDLVNTSSGSGGTNGLRMTAWRRL